MSFVNLMGNDVWSEGDIKARLHAEIRSEVSEFSETEINRALQGKMLGLHTMTAAEMALLMTFKAATERVAILGASARQDALLHAKVLKLEQELALLVVPAVDAADLGAYATYLLALAVSLSAKQVSLAAAEPATLALYNLRNPEVTL